MKTVQRYAVIITAVLFACAILFLGCPNGAGGGKPSISQSGGGSSNPPAGQNVTLTVERGEHIHSVTPATLSVAKGAAWSTVKRNFTVAYEDGYEAAGWKLGSAGGTDITDETVFNENTTVFAVSKRKSAVPSGETVCLRIRGDERINEEASGFIDVDKNKTWAEVKDEVTAKAVLKTEWSAEYYGVYEWRLGSEGGELITDITVFTADTVVYAVTNYTKFKMEGAVIKGYTVQKPRGKIILPAKNEDTPITTIGQHAFYECSNISNLDFSSCTQLTTIGKWAFACCSGLSTLTLPAGLTTIGEYAFYRCSGLTGTLTLPASLTAIGEWAFYGCSNISNLDFSSCTQLTTIMAETFRDCSGLSTLTLPASLTTIMAEAFSGCSGLTDTLTLPAGLLRIRSKAFKDCEKVSIFDFSSCMNFIEIESGAFAGCTAATYKVKKDGTGAVIKQDLIRSGVAGDKIDEVP